MTVLELPALRGDDPQGFLAALGTMSLSSELCGRARLGWDGPAGAALIEVDGIDAVADLAALLRARATELAAHEDRLLHPGLERFPLRKEGTKGADPMLMSPRMAAGMARRASELELIGEPALARWIVALVNQCAPQKRDAEERGLTPLHAPAGQQTVASNYSKSLEAMLAISDEPYRAFTSWRRVEGFAGASLDHRAERDAAVRQDASSANNAAPGPTWLALMSLPLQRLTGDGRFGAATLWQQVPGEEGRRRPAMVWPVWRPVLSPEATVAVIEHPALELRRTPGNLLRPKNPAALRALGVQAVWYAQRRVLGKSAGPLGAARLAWP